MVTEGFKGLAIEISTTKNSFFERNQGFKGVNFDVSLKGFIEPNYGFKGISIQLKLLPNQSIIEQHKMPNTNIPIINNYRVSEDGNERITEDGQTIIID